MRFELTLTPKNEQYTLPLNYQYYLYVSFYIIFDNANEEFKKWAMDNSFSNRNGRYYLYNFSLLDFLNEKKVDIQNATISSSGDVKMVFAAPIFDRKIIDYLKELFLGNNVHFYPPKKENQEFTVKSVRELEEIEFAEEVYYKMRSPSCFFTRNYKHFFQIGDDNLVPSLIYDLKDKYKKVYNEDYEGEFSIEFDKDFIANRKVSKLITIKENTADEYKIRAFQCPMTIKASPKMQYIIYTCGLGMKNKFGFGFVERGEKVVAPEIVKENTKKTEIVENVTNTDLVNEEDSEKQSVGIVFKMKKLFGIGNIFITLLISS